MVEVLGRAIGTGMLAGAIAALLAVPAGMIYGGFPSSGPAQGGWGLVEFLGELLVLVLILAFAGALAGLPFGLVAGVGLGVLRPRLTGRPGRCRIAGALAFGGPVGGYALTLALLGTSPIWWVLLCASELVVAVIVGVWRGPAIVDGWRHPRYQS